MAKSIIALAIGIALSERHIASLDDPAERYAPGLRGTLYGGTAIRNLLRMASGAKYLQTYDHTGDTRRFAQESARAGIEVAARLVTERSHPEGTRFAYASPEASMLAAVVRGATGESVSEYLTRRLWQPLGAETSALWRADRTGLEVAQAHFNATLRDYARLGMLLAADGARPDAPDRQIVPRDFLLDATDWTRADPSFRPGAADRYWGYGYLFWLFPDRQRRFAMLGSFGQAVFVDPGLRLVMVHTAVNATSESHRTSLAREREALWRGVLAFHGGGR
jgi:CubicO group peptidase (beta-lactamase class C family)